MIAYHAFGHVRLRVDNWLNPWTDRQNHGFQIIQSWYAFGSGGVAGTGLGLGQPEAIPNAATDFVFSAIGEELGLVGTIGVLAAFMLLMGSAYRIVVDATRPFAQLFAAGIATILGFQAFLIIGGVTRVIPLTGITLPFVSYGGSSLVANFALLAILLRISDDSVRGRARGVRSTPDEYRNPTRRRRDDGPLPRTRRTAHISPDRGQRTSRTTRRTSRKFLRVISRPRGQIVTSEGIVLAQSVPVNDELKYQRVYPTDPASCSRTSWDSNRSSSARSVWRPSTRRELAGQESRQLAAALSEVLSNRPATGNVVLSLSAEAQPQPRRGSPTGGARWSFSTCRPAASSRCTRTRRSTRHRSHLTTRRRRRRPGSSSRAARQPDARRAPGASSTRRVDVQDRDRVDRAH